MWLPVVKYEGYYEVSSLGQIRRIRSGRNTWIGKILKLQTHNDGYVFVELCKKGKSKRLLISRIVCEAFHGPCPINMNCNHKNGNKSDNSVNNLEWVSHSDNCKHKYNILGHSLAWRKIPPKGNKNPHAKTYILTSPKGKIIKITGLKQFCRENNLKFGPLSGMAAGSNKSKHHRGWSCRRA